MSYELISEQNRTARKNHKCIWCGEVIEQKSMYVRERSKYLGEFQDHAWHQECWESSRNHFINNPDDEDFEPYTFIRGE